MMRYPDEGLAILKAARDGNRIVQIGTHIPSVPQPFREAKEKIIDAGLVGKVGLVRT